MVKKGIVATCSLKEDYNELFNNLITKKKINVCKNKMTEIIKYIYENNDKEYFNIKMIDIYESLDDNNNKEHIENLLKEINLKDLDKITTNKLCPYVNKEIIEIVKKKEEGKNIEYNNFSTEYICAKCGKNQTIIKFTQVRSLDELQSCKLNCVFCNHSWHF
jgi:DNA-directed RNA polymerase subunit M/transcription elongation factor TFIIS